MEEVTFNIIVLVVGVPKEHQKVSIAYSDRQRLTCPPRAWHTGDER